jgi:hypothetical protein
MRTRLRSHPAQHGGRRRPAARERPDAELVLRLQRTIGNRATTRLLREPTVEEDVAQERARFDQAKQEHLRRLAGYAQRDKPQALRKAGITTDSRVDRDTRKWIQAAFAESQKLRPYLKGKFPARAITQGTFEVHTVEDDFNTVAHGLYGGNQPMTKDQRAAAYGKIGGLYDRKTGAVHVRSRTKFGHAMHEAMHKLAHAGWYPFWERTFNEGVTQLMTDCVLQEQGLSIVTDHDYGAELACAKRLVAATSFDAVAKAYFQNDAALRDALVARLRIDLGTLRREINADTLCARL